MTSSASVTASRKPKQHRALRFLTTPSGSALAAAVVGFFLSLLRGPAAAFFYDAQMYWLGAKAVVRFDDFYLDGGLGIRGALSAFVYSPAALVARVFGDDASGVAVLVQNAVLISLVGAVIVPAIASRVVALRPTHVWVSTIIAVLVLGGFAPYPLMDLWAAALLLVAIVLLMRRPWWSSILAGGALAAAVNLRPAHLVPAILILLVWAVYRWRSAWLPLLGAAAALFPQVVVNHVFVRAFSVFPTDTFLITNIQAQYASFTVRYDTVPFAGTDPRLFFCSPDYASEVVGRIPASSGELASSFLGNLPAAILFMSQKVAATLHWAPITPYAEPAGTFSPLTLLVIAVCAIGILALVRAAVRTASMRKSPLLPMLFVLWLGCLATLAVSAPESRFALPVVLVGLVGVLVALPVRASLRVSVLTTRSVWPWIAGTVVLSALLLALGLSGLAHPAPAGDATAATCAAR